MKVIDLLNKIANGEEVPEKIRLYDEEFEYMDGDKTYYSLTNQDPYDLFDSGHYANTLHLNDEVEIIEEDKKIEKLEPTNYITSTFEDAILDKINELIDKVNKLKEGKE